MFLSNGLVHKAPTNTIVDDNCQNDLDYSYITIDIPDNSSLNLSFQKEILSFFPEEKDSNKMADYDDSVDENTDILNTHKEALTQASQNLYNNRSKLIYDKNKKRNISPQSLKSSSTDEDENENEENNIQSKYIENYLIKNFAKKENKISPEKIIIEQDTRTTILIKNVPKHYQPKDLLNELLSNSNLHGKFNFFYLPFNKRNGLNNGFAVINFIHPLHVILFHEMYQNKKFKKYITEQNLKISYIDINFGSFNKDLQNLCDDDHEILIPLKYLDLFKKIYRRSVCIVREVNIYNEGLFSVKNFKKKQN